MSYDHWINQQVCAQALSG